MLKYIMPGRRANNCDMAYKAGFQLLAMGACLVVYQKAVIPMCGYNLNEKGAMGSALKSANEKADVELQRTAAEHKTATEKSDAAHNAEIEKSKKAHDAEIKRLMDVFKLVKDDPTKAWMTMDDVVEDPTITVKDAKLKITVNADREKVFNDFENAYQEEAKRLIAICDGEDKLLASEENKDLSIFKQEWKHNKTPNTIRVVQFNVLAHGLSGKGSGFGTYYNRNRIADLWGRRMKAGDIKTLPARDNNDNLKWFEFGTVPAKPEYEKKVLRPRPILELLYSKTWGQKKNDNNVTNDKLKAQAEDDDPDKVLGVTKEGYAVPARIKRVVALVLKQDADVITLQEVDHFDYIERTLKEFGYEGKFEAKIAGAGCGYKNNGRINGERLAKKYGFKNGCDGVAIFWKTNKFQMDNDEEETRFRLPLVIAAKHAITDKKDDAGNKTGEQLHALTNFVTSVNKVATILDEPKIEISELDKMDSLKFNFVGKKEPKHDAIKDGEYPNIARFDFSTLEEHKNDPSTWKYQAKQTAMKVTLKLTGTDKKITVFSGHFKSGEKPEDRACKPTHTKHFNKAIKKLVENNENVIIGCDFNTAMDTPAFKEFEKEFIENEGQGFTKTMSSSYNYKENDELVNGKPKAHDDKWFTASKWRRGGNQPEKCKLVEQIIDYIFHSNNFKTTGHLPVPTSKQVADKSFLRLPCWQYPSDHFMIGADLVFKN